MYSSQTSVDSRWVSLSHCFQTSYCLLWIPDGCLCLAVFKGRIVSLPLLLFSDFTLSFVSPLTLVVFILVHIVMFSWLLLFLFASVSSLSSFSPTQCYTCTLVVFVQVLFVSFLRGCEMAHEKLSQTKASTENDPSIMSEWQWVKPIISNGLIAWSESLYCEWLHI